MATDGWRFPEDLYYDENHQWAKAQGDLVTTGMTDYAQRAAGDVVFVELPQPGRAVERGDACGSFESGKWVGRIYAPVSGTVAEANQALATDPRTVNRDPYGAGWMVRIRARDLGEMGALMTVAAARALVAAEIARNGPAGPGEGEGDGEP